MLLGPVVIVGVRDPGACGGDGEIVVGVVFEAAIIVFVDVGWTGVAGRGESDGVVLDLYVS